MTNKPLSIDEIRNLVKTNGYDVAEKNKLLTPIGLPGGDIGQLAVIIMAANNYGFEINLEKSFQSLIEVIGGKENLELNTNFYNDPTCSLSKEQMDFIYKKAGVDKIKLHESNFEGAVLLIYGNNKSVTGQFIFKKMPVQVFVFHQTLSDLKNRLLAKKLLENKAIILLPELDEDYLYMALNETIEVYLMETVIKIAKGLPIYKVNFEDGQTEIKEMGVV
jgi:hypothetical protein